MKPMCGDQTVYLIMNAQCLTQGNILWVLGIRHNLLSNFRKNKRCRKAKSEKIGVVA